MVIRHPEKIHKKSNPIPRKPNWIRVKAPTTNLFNFTSKIVKKNNLTTVCEEAACPNIGDCWTKKHATFLIMGGICTRGCAFCTHELSK